MKWRGVFVATVTPFDRETYLSLEGMKRHLEFLAAQGVHGFVPCGTTGESPTLSKEERRAVLELTKQVAVDKGLPVIAGCGSNSTAGALELIQVAEAAQCDAALVVTPYYNKPTPAGLLAHYLHLADKSRIPIVLYHVPGRTGVTLPIEVAAKLLEHKNIVGIKEASGQHSYWLALAGSMNLSEKALMAGDDDAYATIGALGGSGIISASANVIPAQFVAIHDAMEKGDWAEAFRLQKKVAPLVRSLFAETNPAPVKYALNRLRGLENVLRLPLVPVTPATESLIQSALKGLEAGPKS